MFYGYFIFFPNAENGQFEGQFIAKIGKNEIGKLLQIDGGYLSTIISGFLTGDNFRILVGICKHDNGRIWRFNSDDKTRQNVYHHVGFIWGSFLRPFHFCHDYKTANLTYGSSGIDNFLIRFSD